MGQLIRDPNMAYLAGHLDGDGTIAFSDSRGYVRIQWISTQEITLNEIQKMLDRSYIFSTMSSCGLKKCPSMKKVTVNKQGDCRMVLEQLAPYLAVKGVAAERMLSHLGSKIKISTNPVDWDWLAGFTDTDGCISSKRRWQNTQKATHYVHWTQKGDNDVLSEIESFLGRFKTYTAYLHSGVSQLVAARQKEVLEILKSLYPFLIEKKRKAKMAISDLEVRYS